MELRDLIVTPIVIILVYAAAYFIRPRVTDEVTRRYFFPALTLRIFCAIALGFLYQFYYDGGDTFNFHTHGSRVIWEAFMESPIVGIKLLFSNGEHVTGAYSYISKIPFYGDRSSFFIVQVAVLFDLITFSTYSATAVCFAVISFCGSWALFQAFYRQSPGYHFWLALATLFMPSVTFWGSGILKDTLTLAALGVLTLMVSNLFIQNNWKFSNWLLAILSIWILFSVKKYILLCYMPAALLWIYAAKLAMIRSQMVKILIVPVVLMVMLASAYYAIVLIGKDDPRYSLDRIAMTAQITAYDIGFYSGKDAGSGYSLGELDGTFVNLMSKIPQAINVSLFRPYLWEVKNPLMLFSAAESVAVLLITVYVVAFRLRKPGIGLTHPTILFCLVFSLTFAFAVGVSTFNYGTLARYKIPLLPFYLVAMIYLYHYSNKEKKLDWFESTE